MDAAAYLKDAAFQQLLLNEGWDMGIGPFFLRDVNNL